jgi:hypothetical protein
MLTPEIIASMVTESLGQGYRPDERQEAARRLAQDLEQDRAKVAKEEEEPERWDGMA